MAVAAILLLLLTLAAAPTDTTIEEERERIEEERRQVMAEREMTRIEEEQQQIMAEWKAKDGNNFRERSEKEARFLFAKWTIRHGKKYSSTREEKRRYAIFKDNLRAVDEENAAFGRKSYRSSIDGPFSDLTHEEWVSSPMVNGYIPDKPIRPQQKQRGFIMFERPEITRPASGSIKVWEELLLNHAEFFRDKLLQYFDGHSFSYLT